MHGIMQWDRDVVLHTQDSDFRTRLPRHFCFSHRQLIRYYEKIVVACMQGRDQPLRPQYMQCGQSAPHGWDARLDLASCFSFLSYMEMMGILGLNGIEASSSGKTEELALIIIKAVLERFRVVTFRPPICLVP